MFSRLLLIVTLLLSFFSLHAQNCPGYANTASGSGEACGNQIYILTVENTDCNGEIYITIETNFANGYGFSWDLESVSTGNTVGSGNNGGTTVTIGPIDPNTEGNSFDLIVNDPNGVGFLASEFVEASQGGNILATVDNPGHQMFASNITISDATITIQTPSGGPITETVENCKDFIIQVPLTNDDYCTTKNINLPWEITCDETGATISSGNHSVTVGPQVPNDPSDLVDITWNTTSCSWDVSTNFDCDNADIGDIFDISPDPSTSPSDVCIDSDETFTISYNGISGGPNCCATAGPLTDITYNETIDPGNVTSSTSPFWTDSDHAGYIHFPPNGTGGNATSIDLCVEVNNFCFENPTNDQYYYVFIYVDGINVVQEPHPNGGNANICLDLTDVPTYDQSSNVEIYVFPNAFNVNYGIFFPDFVNTTFQPSKPCSNLGDAEWNADIEATIDVTFEEQIGTPVACSEDITVPYTNCGIPQPTTSVNTAADCNNSSTVSVTNYDNTFTYSISPSGASIDGTGVISGTDGNYTLTVSNGECDETASITIDGAVGNPTFTLTTTDPSCGSSDGEIVITPDPGFTITDYSIDGGATTQSGGTFSNLGTGSYDIVVTDNSGCESDSTITLNSAGSTDDASFSLTDFCEGSTNSATITGDSGGTFAITSPTGDGATIDASTGEITDGVGGTTYTIEYTTSGSCPVSETHDVTVNPLPTYNTIATTEPSCGNNDGEIEITAGAGFTITDYSIDNGVTTQSSGTFSNLDAGSYDIVIVDDNGCENDSTIALSSASGPSIDNISTTDASCAADDGTITVSASGGTGSLSYELDNGDTSNDGNFTGLADGDYTVTVTDDNSCEATQSVTVGKASGFTLTIDNSTDVSCFGEADGTAEVSATGGTTPYTYDWSPEGGTNASATDLPAGTYTVTVTDGAGCTEDVQITITEPDLITIDETITNADCEADNGEIALNVTGGTGSYTYTWNPNVSTSDQATDLAVGSYEVTVTDDNGCERIASYNIIQGNSFYIETIPEDSTTVLQGESVDLNLFVEPGIEVEDITWTPAEGLSCWDCKNPTAKPQEGTTYIVTVTDINGCTSADTVKINVILPCADVFVPNTFSPNKDGLNDQQCVFGECIVTLDFAIFNRWGETVFKTGDQEECWDGTHRGKNVQSGTYVYKLKATLEDGTKVEDTGNITVVR